MLLWLWCLTWIICTWWSFLLLRWLLLCSQLLFHLRLFSFILSCLLPNSSLSFPLHFHFSCLSFSIFIIFTLFFLLILTMNSKLRLLLLSTPILIIFFMNHIEVFSSLPSFIWWLFSWIIGITLSIADVDLVIGLVTEVGLIKCHGSTSCFFVFCRSSTSFSIIFTFWFVRIWN